MVRTQAQLTPVHLSEIIRQAADAARARQHEPTREELIVRAMSIVGIADLGPEDLSVNHDKYLAEAGFQSVTAI